MFQAFPIGSPLVHDVSQAIMIPSVQEEMVQIENKWFGVPGVCQSKSSSINSSRLGFSNFSGLFLITGVTSGLALFIYLAIFMYRERDRLRVKLTCTESMSLKRLHEWVERHVSTKHKGLPIAEGQELDSERNGQGACQFEVDG